MEEKFEAQNAAQVTQFNTVIGSIEKFLQNFKNDLGFGSILNFYLTLTRPIGLPPHAPVAQKIAGQRWLIANLAKNRHLFI